MNKERELLIQAIDAYDIASSPCSDRLHHAFEEIRNYLICEPESDEPVAWVDPSTLHKLRLGLEGVHLVYETEMVNSLPLFEKPQGWRDNVAQAYLKGFDEGCKTRNGDTTGRWSGK